jgi:hypothetical protein
VKIEKIKAALTEREFRLYQALQAEDTEALKEFGEDLDLLKRSVEAKLEALEPPKVRNKELVVPDFEEAAPQPPEENDVLGRIAYTKPLGKGDIARGQRVMYQASGGIHRVLSVDRTQDPEIITIEMFGKAFKVPRTHVSKVAPMQFDPKFRRKRAKPVAFAGAHATRYDDIGNDPQDS